MAKYICDFDQVNAIGEKVCAAAEEMEASLKTYASNIDGNLSSWSGNAKSAFTTTNDEQVKATTADLAYVKELGEFIKSSAKSIQELESQLSSLSI